MSSYNYYSVGELGSDAVCGNLALHDTQFHGGTPYELSKGSLWTAEWSPDGGSICVGTTGGGFVLDSENWTAKCNLHTFKSDVFTQCWTQDVRE